MAINQPTVIQSNTGQSTVIQKGGQQGVPGVAATVSVGTVTTVSPSSPASVQNAGTPLNAVLDFEIPQGETGNAATVEIGTVTTLAPGAQATATNAGTPNNLILDLGIPQGEVGPGGSVNSFNTRVGNVTLQSSDVTGVLRLVSVVDFGADPSGVNDSTSAFQSAINTGMPIFVPSGKYSVSGVLNVSSNLNIFGIRDFSVITFTGSGGFSISSYAHFLFKGLTFVCNGSEPAIQSDYAFSAGPTPAFLIDSCNFYNASSCNAANMVFITNARESVITNCVFDASVNMPNAISIFSECINITISDCMICNLFTSSGISVNGNNSTVGCQGIDISNCILIGGNAGLLVGNNVDWLACTNVQIDNVASPVIAEGDINSLVFSNCEFGASNQDGITGTSVVQLAGNGAISNLNFSNCSFSQYNNTGYCISNNTGSGLTITGFSVIGCVFSGSPTVQYQMPAPYAFGNTFSGNVNNFLSANTAVTNSQIASVSPIGASASSGSSSSETATTGALTAPANGTAIAFVNAGVSSPSASSLSISSSLAGGNTIGMQTGGIVMSGLLYLPMSAGQSSTFTATASNGTATTITVGIGVIFIPHS